MNHPIKRCPKCKNEFPATPEFFDRNKNGRFGLHSCCKSCRSQSAREWREKNSERHAENCRNWQKNNPEKEAAKTRRWRERHPEKVKEIYLNRDKDYYRDIMRDYRLRHPDRKSKKTPEQSRAAYHRRRAMKEKIGGHFTEKDVQRQYTSQNGRCWWCGCELDNTFHVDHVIPISRGGSNAPNNIVISCPTCNLSKGSKLPQEWCGRLF